MSPDRDHSGSGFSMPRSSLIGTVGDAPSPKLAPSESRRPGGAIDPGDLVPLAAGPVLAIGAAVVILLLAVAARYGYHRDELYFLAAGHHLAWGYPDQPPLVPVLARLLSDMAPGSLILLRTPSALAAGGLVILAALSAREFGAGRSGQLLASAAMATGGVLYGIGHLLSTATFYVLATAVLFWLVARTLRTGNQRGWLYVGLVAGAGLLDNDLVAFVVAGIVAGLLLAGPRDAFRSGWLWAGGVVAAALWAPYLVWQATHSWPELTVSRSIAAGHSGSSQPRALLLPEQLAMLSPYLAPVWIVGLARTLRHRAYGRWRWVGIAWLFLALVFLATGGKSYYLAGTFPILLGAGAQPAVDWVRNHGWSRTGIAVGLALSAVGAALFSLPVLPLGVLHDTPVVSVNYDIGETVGWPTYVAEIATVYRGLGTDARRATAVVTSNYGEAGAIDRFGASLGLPAAYSVHNGFWYWGPPPPASTRALAVGFTASAVSGLCADPALAIRLTNPWQVGNQEQDVPVWVCTRLRGTWSQLWSRLRVIG